MTGKRKIRVSWTEEEVSKVVESAVKHFFEDKELAWAFIAQGQKVLPVERQRTIAGRAGVGKMVLEKFFQLRQEILERGVPFQVNITNEVLVEKPVDEVLHEVSTERLTGLLIGRLASLVDVLGKVVTESRDRMVAPPATPHGHLAESRPNAVVQPAPSSRKVRVLLYGFLPGQETELRERASAFSLDLVFQRGRQTTKPPSVQWCIAINKLSHSASDKLGSKLENRIRLVEGTTGALKELAEINSLVGTGVR